MKRSLLVPTIAVGALIATFATSPARAQVPGYAINRFEPSERGSDWFSADSLDLRGKARPAFGVVGDYAYRPQSFHNDDGTVALVKNQLTMHVGAGITLANRLRFAVDVPIVVDQSGSDLVAGGRSYLAPSASSAVGDLRIAADVRLLGEYGTPFTLAFGARFWAPTGKAESYTGDGKARVSPHLSIAGDVAAFTYALSVGFAYRAAHDEFGETAIGSEIPFRLALGARLLDKKLTLGPELHGSTVVSGTGTEKLPLAMLIGGHWTAGDFRLGVGGGPGLSHASGTAQLRLLAAIEWVPGIEEAPPPVLVPATPPPDKDGDGVLDANDACPTVRGVHTSDPKTDGCPPPEPDKDGDGIPDLVDACVDVAGMRDPDPKKNGCPPDKDADGIPDLVDACLNIPGVKSDDPAKNGCPPDKDGDGIPDAQDACPELPGKNDPDPKKNGCPLVKIEAGQVKILEQIKFKTGSAQILPESQGILDAVANTMKEHPELKKVRVEGHTDNVGGKAFNKTLSTNRAAAVLAALVKLGVEKTRLRSVGMGQDVPIDVNTTEEGRANNRRVEFHIEIGPKTPAPTP
jgi:OOP family OmpA-OmpF porin